MRPYHAALAVVFVVLLGWAALGHADGRGGHSGHGGGPGFHGGAQGFHGGRGAFHGHPGGGFHGHPGFHGRAFIGVAPFWWGGGYVYAPPPVYAQPGYAGYWYYCPSAQAYYPNVPSCPEPWVLVPAS
jgi:hypothetical protein